MSETSDKAVSTKPKKKFSLKNKYITKREIIIIAAVALVIFIIMCDKPFSNDLLFLFKPAFWSSQTLPSNNALVFTIPKPGAGEDDVSQDKIVITDISSELGEEISTAKDYIISQINYQVDYAMDVSVPDDKTSEQVQIFETGRVNIGGQDAYYFIFTPGGEYSGNKVLQVAIKKGDKMIEARYSSRWMNFEGNYEKAFSMIKSIRLK